MKRIVGVVAVTSIMAVALLVGSQAAAQNRLDSFVLEGFGSTIGVTVRDLSPTDASGDAARGGVVIDRVQSGTPAARAGFKPGDVVVEFDGERVRSARQFTRLVRETPPGRNVSAVVLRGGSRETVTVAPEARRAGDLVPPDIEERIERSLRRLPRNLEFDFDFDVDVPEVTVLRRARLGATVTSLNAQLAEYFGVTEGVLVQSVQADSPAARAGLRAGDVITSIGGNPVRTPGDVARHMRQMQSGDTAELRVVRDRNEMTLTLSAPERPTAGRGRGITA